MTASSDVLIAETLPMRDRLRRAPWRLMTPTLGLFLHGLALLAIVHYPFRVAYLPLLLIMYTWMCGATGLYMHRSLAHRSFRLVMPLDLLMCIGTSVSLGGDPVRWVAIHRHHHVHSDTPEDIHSPRHGFLTGHGLWAHKLNLNMIHELLPNSRDVAEVAYRRWMLKPPIYITPHLLVAALIWWFMGTGALLWVLYVPLVLLIHVTHAVNSFGHMPRFGYRRYVHDDDSTNVPWLAIFSLGDSFHNNHHHQPRRTGHGHKWWELDINKGIVWTLEKLGLARDVIW
jgi:fatty-acid desaturase